MIGYGLDRGGLKDSENAPNSFLTKINKKGIWRFATDMYIVQHKDFEQHFWNLISKQTQSKDYN